MPPASHPYDTEKPRYAAGQPVQLLGSKLNFHIASWGQGKYKLLGQARPVPSGLISADAHAYPAAGTRVLLHDRRGDGALLVVESCGCGGVNAYSPFTGDFFPVPWPRLSHYADSGYSFLDFSPLPPSEFDGVFEKARILHETSAERATKEASRLGFGSAPLRASTPSLLQYRAK